MAIKVDAKDCLFVITQFEGDYWVAAITPKEYFAKHECLIDQHLNLNPQLKKWGAIQEAIFESSLPTPEEMHNSLLAEGLEYSEKLGSFLAKVGNPVFRP